MERMRATRHRAVIVRDGAGQIVHTHEVIEFDDVPTLSEDELIRQAVDLARNAHSAGDGDFRGVLSSPAELEAMRRERLDLPRPQSEGR
jgi:hypothetical protein